MDEPFQPCRPRQSLLQIVMYPVCREVPQHGEVMSSGEKGTFAICGQLRPRSDCAFAQSDQGLRCPLKYIVKYNDDPVQAAHLLRLIWVFTVRIWHNDIFPTCASKKSI